MDNFRYTNSFCPICGKQFTLEDDIVVCPICGTPHHRECYTSNGSCFNTKFHKDGFVWAPVQNPNEPVQDENFQQNAQYDIPNQPNANETVPPYGPFQTMQGFNPLAAFPPEFEDGTKTIDVVAYTNKSAPYYVHNFFVQDTGKKTFNFWAFLFDAYWFFYRKMYKIGVICIVINLLLTSLLVLLPQSRKLSNEYYDLATKYNQSESLNDEGVINGYFEDTMALIKNNRVGTIIWMAVFALNCAIKVYLGLNANKLYQKHAFSSVKKINSTIQDEQVRRMRIVNDGGVSFIALLCAYTVMRTLNFFIDFLANNIYK